MKDSIQDIRTRRNYFYRNNYRRLLSLVLLLLLTSIGLSLFLGYLNYNVSPPKYYATTPNGQITSMHSLSEPLVTQDFVVQWAALAARTVYNLDFVNWQTQLQAAQIYFTPNGWAALMLGLNNSGMTNSLKNNKLQATAVVVKDPVILDREVINGRYTWQIQLPLLVTYVSASDTKKQLLVITLSIVRVSTLDTA